MKVTLKTDERGHFICGECGGSTYGAFVEGKWGVKCRVCETFFAEVESTVAANVNEQTAEPQTSRQLQRQLTQELAGITCRCGQHKTARNTFCGQCYRALPPCKRRALYKKMGAGYEEAYHDAINFLFPHLNPKQQKHV